MFPSGVWWVILCEVDWVRVHWIEVEWEVLWVSGEAGAVWFVGGVDVEWSARCWAKDVRCRRRRGSAVCGTRPRRSCSDRFGHRLRSQKRKRTVDLGALCRGCIQFAEDGAHVVEHKIVNFLLTTGSLDTLCLQSCAFAPAGAKCMNLSSKSLNPSP